MTYLVNPDGATHSVPDSRREGLLAEGFRDATPEEVAAFYSGQGLTPPTEEELANHRLDDDGAPPRRPRAKKGEKGEGDGAAA
jgi:hypothetical protein